MPQQIQLRYDSAANWTSNNPILGIAEAGYELVTGNVKIGDGVTRWNALSYKIFNIKGDKGDPGTGLSRQLSTTIDFTTIAGELQYVEKTIIDAAILSTSVIIIQITDSDFVAQNVQCGVVSITQGVGYIIYANAPDGATGVMSINILIF